MLNGLIVKIAKLAYGRQILEVVDGLHERVIGHRSEIIIGLIILVSAARHLGLISSDVANSSITGLLGALPLTLASKVGNALKQADAVLPQVPLPNASIGHD